MGQHINQFCEDLREKLTAIDDGLTQLKINIADRNADAARKVQDRLDAIEAQVEARRQKIAAANQSAKAWIEEKKRATAAEIAAWKSAHEQHKLERRAEQAQAYAQLASEIAAAAIDQAEQAALEAWLARFDADGAR